MMRTQKRAFTLIELLVVISLIAALVGILAVAQKKVKTVARNLRQKAEFHGMEISLELFSTDFKGYPDSEVVNGTGTQVCGAQRLAEAMLGRDENGFHPRTKWHPELETDDIYLLNTASPTQEEMDNSLKQRKGPYFELKHSDLYTLDDLWGSVGGAGTLQDDQCPVLTDVFNFNKVTDTNGESIRVGSPVLYFKADPTKKFRVDATNQEEQATLSGQEYTDWVYNLNDNRHLLELTWLREPSDPAETVGFPPHYQDPDDNSKDPAQYFYELLTQREDTTRNFFKPYNANTFILISAGWDGIFGTDDDITSFNY
jgi:prepilin-type N-terminal cleavage/methylation domain-containing protein